MSEREPGEATDVRLEGPLDLRTLRLPPGVLRRTVVIESGGALCADGAAWCGELIAVNDGVIDVVVRGGGTQRLDAGALLFVEGLTDVELRCVGSSPAVLIGLRRIPVGTTAAEECVVVAGDGEGAMTAG